ncbi:MAG: FHA domain-containing protein [Firmicutes bacterium]|nr:FHA domain-containing protein [Bacillota bacterium]MCL5058289.1 FHA domain-containing protein [Actinomycetota bacterium]
MSEEFYGFRLSEVEDPPGLMLEHGEGAGLIHYQVEMITGNSIPGLLGAAVRRRDDLFSICYHSVEYIPLGVYLKKEGITRDQFILMVNHLKNIFREIKKYFLSPDSIVLAERYIYVKEGLKDMALLYIPGELRQDINTSLRDLLISIIAHSEDAADPDMARFTKSIKEGGVSINNLDRFIMEFFTRYEKFKTVSLPGPEGHPGPDPPDRPESQGRSTGKRTGIYAGGAIAAAVFAVAAAGEKAPGLQTAAGLLLALISAGAVLYIYLKTRAAGVGREKEDSSQGPGAAERSAGGPAADSVPRAKTPGAGVFVPLVYKKAEKKMELPPTQGSPGNGAPVLKISREGKEEIVLIDKKEFYIGRSRAVADYGEISDEGVEKIHAKIISSDTGYQIMDLGTEKGTYVNGQRIESSRPHRIKYKDVIMLAGLELVFDQG